MKQPGDTVAVVGSGAVGLSAILTTGLWGASRVIAIDTNKFRLDKALEFGATDAVEGGDNTTADVMALTGGAGVDVAIEAVGYPETLLTAASLVRPGAPSPTSACMAPRSCCPCRTGGSRTSP